MKELKLSFPYPATSKHNLSQDVATSLGFGMLTPIRCVEVLPGDSHRIRTSFSLLSNPLVKPLLQGVRLRYCRFWVPRRIYHLDQRANNSGFEPHDQNYRWSDIQLYSTHVKDSDTSILSDHSQVQASSMFDYFRMVVGNDFIYHNTSIPVNPSPVYTSSRDKVPLSGKWPFNAEPFVAYYDICRNYFGDSATGTIAFQVRSGSADFPSLSMNSTNVLIYPLSRLDTYVDGIQNDTATRVSAPNFYSGLGSYGIEPTKNNFNPFFLTPEVPQNYSYTTSPVSWQSWRISHHGLCVPSNRADRLSRLFNTDPLTSQNATVQANEVTIGNLSFLAKMQRYLTRRFFGGSRFTDVMYSVYGQNVPHVDSPVCLDVFDYELGTELVASTNATPDQNPGVIGGYFQAAGILSTRNGRESRRYRFNEGGYIIDLCYIMPRLYRETFVPDYFFVDVEPPLLNQLASSSPSQGSWVPDFNGIGWQQPSFVQQFRYQTSSAFATNTYFVVPGFASEGAWQQYRTLPDISSGLLNSTNGIPMSGSSADPASSAYPRIVPDLNSPIMIFGDHRGRPNYIEATYANNVPSAGFENYLPLRQLSSMLYSNPVDFYAVFGVSNIDFDPFHVVFNYAHQSKRQVTKRFTLTFA